MDADSLSRLDKTELIALVLAQAGQIAVLTARVAALEARLAVPPKTPSNSSVPPSKGQKANRPEKGRKRRKGRPGVARALCPDPDATREIYAERCSCGAALGPGDQPHVHAYDHIDLPPIKPVTTRINLHKGHCPRCGKPVAAKPPADMAPGSPFGPGIVSAVTYFHASQMISYSRLTEMLGGVFGLTVSEGAIANMLRRAARPFAGAADDIAAIVRASPVIASDETSARVAGKTWWPQVDRPAFGRVDVRRGDGDLSHDRADARQGRADRVSGRSQTEGLALRSPRRPMQSCRRASGLPRASDPRRPIRH